MKLKITASLALALFTSISVFAQTPPWMRQDAKIEKPAPRVNDPKAKSTEVGLVEVLKRYDKDPTEAYAYFHNMNIQTSGPQGQLADDEQGGKYLIIELRSARTKALLQITSEAFDKLSKDGYPANRGTIFRGVIDKLNDDSSMLFIRDCKLFLDGNMGSKGL
jgi:hypothetical protein